MGGATAARTVEYHRLSRRVKAFGASAKTNGLLPRASAHPVGIELADFPRLAGLSRHAEADGAFLRVVVGDPGVRTVPPGVEALPPTGRTTAPAGAPARSTLRRISARTRSISCGRRRRLARLATSCRPLASAGVAGAGWRAR